MHNLKKGMVINMDYRFNNIILEKLEKAAAEHPEKIAFKEYGGSFLTFAELRDKAYAVANALRDTFPDGLGDAPVAVMAHRDPMTVAGMLGVIAAGGWYVPVDAELPPERLRLLLGVCRPSAVVTCSAEDSPENEAEISALGVPVIRSARLAGVSDFIPAIREENQPMFGIFTSGSTGIPKLVVKSRLAMMSFIKVYCEQFGFGENEIFGNQIPFYFDASTKDIFSTVYLGATTVIIPQKCFSFPVDLVKILNEEKVTTIMWVPSALSIAARFNVFAAAKPGFLKNVLFVGEQMPIKYINIWREALPQVRYVNLYGSTEVAGNSCFYVLDRDFDPAGILPIGHPFSNTEVFLLDPETGLPAQEGELCISGDGLAAGYYNDPDKTAAAFRTTDFPDHQRRIYHSGDFGKLNEYGEFVCISRRDAQIKHMGHRIELGEIEAAANSLPYIREACCFYSHAEEKILLCYAAAEDVKKQLRSDLGRLLPKYMIPHKYFLYDTLPHNRNGKIDRAGLRAEVIEEGGKK
ncbi:MAG: AMP-binding protein [Clostridia bacterium]|nr:AMP-binding protein [Clostridia bacterium]